MLWLNVIVKFDYKFGNNKVGCIFSYTKTELFGVEYSQFLSSNFNKIDIFNKIDLSLYEDELELF